MPVTVIHIAAANMNYTNLASLILTDDMHVVHTTTVYCGFRPDRDSVAGSAHLIVRVLSDPATARPL